MQANKTQRKRKDWFINRVGKEVSQSILLTRNIKIESEQHAIALYLTQVEKNYSYNDTK